MAAEKRIGSLTEPRQSDSSNSMTHQIIHDPPRARTVQHMREVLASERQAIQRLENTITESIADVVKVLKDCCGHIVVSGMGKSGLIGRKIAASLSSTGTPAIFLHAAEACHGDLGCVRESDVLLALSASGETPELIQVVAAVKRMGCIVVSLTGSSESTLARLSDFMVDVGVDCESDPFNCVPTASSVAMLAMGDALSITLLKERRFTREALAELHPGGTLGRRLLWKVSDLMHTDARIPIVPPEATVADALLEMTQKRFGATFVSGPDKCLLGIVTDGDLRRLLQCRPDPLKDTVSEVMTVSPRSASPELMASEALQLLEDFTISVLPVLNSAQQIIGVIHLHDILQCGIR